ncbi:hypothetical protein [Xanthomonas medicagonis]|uniref:AbiU2 domain-containing protein n=1 Tax=Xanthomonas medicagonis TaxID=3160841 RepID=UPI003513F174
MSHRDFSNQLESFRQESEVVAQLVYGDFAVNQAALDSNEVFAAMNETPRLWNLWAYATQVASFMALGRLFDMKSSYSLDALLDSMQKNIHDFQENGLRARKDPKGENPAWLDSYLAEAYYPTYDDVKRLRKMVDRRRAIYDRMIKPARHKYFAHREKHEANAVRDLFQRGTIDELWLLTSFLLQLHDQLFQLYFNGRKPVFRRTPYSIRSVRKRAANSSRPHHKLILEISETMRRIVAGSPSNSFKPNPFGGSA